MVEDGNVDEAVPFGRASLRHALALRLQLFTKSAAELKAIHALLDWDEASTANGLTEAQAKFRAEDPGRVDFPDASETGTRSAGDRFNNGLSSTGPATEFG